MGAHFDSGIAEGPTLDKAFAALIEQKCWEHGHGGYSGTLAEKSEVSELRVPANCELTAEEWVHTIQRLAEWVDGYYWNGDEGKRAHAELKTKLDRHYDEAVRQAQLLDGDKWGPAFAVKLDTGKWWVGGYCSS